MDDDLARLDALAARLRELDKVGTAIATDARADVEAAARATAAAGTTAEGTAWKQTKAGTRPLAHAASAISAVVSGTTKAVITLVLKGRYVFHHHGTKHVPARPILPDPSEGIPSRITDAIRAATSRVLGKTLGGRS